jgi:hypothetical protein
MEAWVRGNCTAITYITIPERLLLKSDKVLINFFVNLLDTYMNTEGKSHDS